MNPAAVLALADQAGVSFSISAAGTLKAKGGREQVACLAPLIKEHKDALLAHLKAGRKYVSALSPALQMCLLQQGALNMLQMKTGATGIRRMVISGKRFRRENTNGEGAIIAQPAIGFKPGAQDWAVDGRAGRPHEMPCLLPADCRQGMILFRQRGGGG